MINMLKAFVFLMFILILACANDQNYTKGLELYEAGKYEEAKTMFKLVKPNTHSYELATKYILNSDSLILLKKINKLTEVDSALSNYKRMDFPQSIQDLSIEVAYFVLIGKTINDVKIMNLPERQKQIQYLDSLLVNVQIKQFPKLREEYGEILGKILWKDDIDVSVSGPAAKSIEFTSSLFSSNANIDAFHNKLKESLFDFRFDQAIYRWYKFDTDQEMLRIYSSDDSHIRVF